MKQMEQLVLYIGKKYMDKRLYKKVKYMYIYGKKVNEFKTNG